MSTFEKTYAIKMWRMSTLKKQKLKKTFFVSTFLDYYNYFRKKYRANQSPDFLHDRLIHS